MTEPDHWGLRIYDRAERITAGILLLGMFAVVALATLSFFVTVGRIVISSGGQLEYERFQLVFESVLAALIALELAHSIRQMVMGEHGLAQLRTVIVIGMLAVVRKLIVLDVETASGLFLVGIASAILALAVGLVATRWAGERRITEDR